MSVNSFSSGLTYIYLSLGSLLSGNEVRTLVDLAARVTARNYSFQMLETSYHAISAERRRMNLLRSVEDSNIVIFESDFVEHSAIPDKFFLGIIRWCFPDNEADVRLYSCLANGSSDEFDRGEYLYQTGAVQDVFQIGYHISGVVNVKGALTVDTRKAVPPSRSKAGTYNVSVQVDRCRVVSCSCSCVFKASWCQHVVALCLYRLHRSDEVEYRVTIWDSINELTNEKLKKLAQFLINDLPRQYLPVAQRLIDHLRDPKSEINLAVGAPDPTDGGHENVAIWCMDQRTLHENIHNILIKFCIPGPTVHCDVQYLSSNQPPTASEWTCLFRPHRTKEPEGLWNLLSIVREMFRRRDENATSLLHIITEECMACSHVLTWWYQGALSRSGRWAFCSRSNSLLSNLKTPQINCSSLCDEIVQLWKIAALNPRLQCLEREQLANFIQIYHRNAVDRIWEYICFLGSSPAVSSQPSSSVLTISDRQGHRLTAHNARFTAELFPGFLNALKACQISWDNTFVNGLPAGPDRVLSNSHAPHVLIGITNSPNIPILQRPLRVSQDSNVVDARTSFYCPPLFKIGECISIHQEMSRKRKKRFRLYRRRGHQFSFHGDQGSTRSSRSVMSSTRQVTSGELDDSGESGQESETGPSRSKSSTSSDPKSQTDVSVTRLRKNDVDELFAIAHVQQSNWDIKFSKCEALVAHGYEQHACVIAEELAQEMLHCPPNLLYQPERCVSEFSVTQQHKRRLSPPSSSISNSETSVLDEHHIEKSQLAEDTYMRTLFLVQTLMKKPTTHQLAFTLAISILELPRSPAVNRFLEVKLYFLETELIGLLRRIEIGTSELQLIRDRARDFVENASFLSAVPQLCVLPISLGHYILDSLSFSQITYQGRRTGSGIVMKSDVERNPSDEQLAMKVALEALGMKLLVSEAEYPMLCESTRLQRADLALTMLLRYKDDMSRLALVLDKLLDPCMHRIDHQSNAAFFLDQVPAYKKYFNRQRPQFRPGDEFHYDQARKVENVCLFDAEVGTNVRNIHEENINRNGAINEAEQMVSSFVHLSHDSPDDSSSITSVSRRRSSDDGNESIYDESSSSGVTRCFQRGILREYQSTSLGAPDSPSPSYRLSNAESKTDFSSTTVHSVDSSVFVRHNRRKQALVLPNHVSEGQAHCMMELAKRLLLEAGGSQNTVIFNAAQGNQNNSLRSGPHRHLHICSFLIGLYALGLNNLLSASWQTRTYSTNVSWIHGQAVEIGCAAIEILEEVWETHLTPTEVAALADKASQSRDPCMVEAGARLALSVLPKAYALTAAESQKALHQCKEHSSEMLEKACRAVEQAAEKDGVYPEVLFKVARHWFDLFLKSEVENNLQAAYQIGVSSLQSLYSVTAPQLYTDAMQQQTMYSVATSQARLQISVQCRPQSLPYAPTSFHVHHHHSGPPNRPPVYVPPVSTQPQVEIHFSPRGPLPMGALSMVSSHHGPRQRLSAIYNPIVNTTPSRALHVSRSAPNLGPIPTVHLSRCNQPLAVLPQRPLVIGAGGTHRQFPSVGEQGTQEIPVNGLHHLPPPTSLVICPAVSQPVTYFEQGSTQHPVNVSLSSSNSSVMGDPRMAKLVHAHRVGMIAMETMGSRNLDDNRSYAKFSQNPAYAEDVHWLFRVATRLGGVFIQSFCEVAARSIASPFVLFSLAVESAKWQIPSVGYHSQPVLQPILPHLNGGPPNVRAVLLQNGCAPPTADLMQRCIEMFYAATSSKLSHPRFVPSDVEEVIQLIKAAKEAFYWVPGVGKFLFDDFMRHKVIRECTGSSAE
ncbi:unnamed protein product [Thelazia callipaeda]|uniref:SWIM-type domain-containing protein n=1 Tax=Thelazia callipaeda TaxID=103827 RepID=A0A0N5CYI4_THECL|nr:unnamed protein product [Thelazia callipaeda]